MEIYVYDHKKNIARQTTNVLDILSKVGGFYVSIKGFLAALVYSFSFSMLNA
jgi:hypothetical protein